MKTLGINADEALWRNNTLPEAPPMLHTERCWSPATVAFSLTVAFLSAVLWLAVRLATGLL